MGELEKVEANYKEKVKDFKKEGRNMVRFILYQLGQVLDTDGRTTVLISSLRPEYTKTLLINTRDICYIPVTPLNKI